MDKTSATLDKFARARQNLQELYESVPPADQDKLVIQLAAHLQRSLEELRLAERDFSRLPQSGNVKLALELAAERRPEQQEEQQARSQQVNPRNERQEQVNTASHSTMHSSAMRSSALPSPTPSALPSSALQERQSIEMLAAGVAHIFNNLLTAVACDADVMLAELKTDHPLRENIRAIQSNVRRGGSLTRRLLAFGRRQLLEPQETQVNELIRELEAPLRQLTAEAGVSLRFDLAKDLGQVWIDPAHLEQVVIDLVVNACEAMPKGGVLAIKSAALETARFGDGDELEDAVALAVSDTGRGIPDAEVERLFAPFYSTKEPYEGAGLSLAAARSIIEESGGFIEVESSPGQGSTFRIVLPRVSRERARSSSAPVPAAASVETAPWVMLVEDEGNVRRPLTRILENEGFRVLSAEDAEQAMRLARQHPEQIDVLVTDLIMPGSNGLELAEKLAKERPQLKVLVTTGYPGALRDRAIDGKTGEVRVLRKPFTGRELCLEIGRLLAQGRPASQERARQS